MSNESVYRSIMGGQIMALQEAILTIVRANQGCLQGVLNGADLDDAINAAEELLPLEMREEEVPLRKNRKPGGYEDLGL